MLSIWKKWLDMPSLLNVQHLSKKSASFGFHVPIYPIYCGTTKADGFEASHRSFSPINWAWSLKNRNQERMTVRCSWRVTGRTSCGDDMVKKKLLTFKLAGFGKRSSSKNSKVDTWISVHDWQYQQERGMKKNRAKMVQNKLWYRPRGLYEESHQRPHKGGWLLL